MLKFPNSLPCEHHAASILHSGLALPLHLSPHRQNPLASSELSHPGPLQSFFLCPICFSSNFPPGQAACRCPSSSPSGAPSTVSFSMPCFFLFFIAPVTDPHDCVCVLWGDFPPPSPVLKRGDAWKWLETFLVVTSGAREATGIWRVEPRDSDQHATRHSGQ